MKSWRLTDWANRTGAEMMGEDASVTSYATDSRDVRPGSLFIAIKGARVDGHAYLSQVFESGAAGALVQNPSGKGPELVVPDVIGALAAFAATVREEFCGPVVGVTGSNGKTTTKEFSAAALSPLGKVLKSQGNRNSEFTSPLVWAEADLDEKAAVVEMGMRGFGQISHLAAFSRPTIGIVTVVGTAHIEMVGTRAGIAQAKSELLQGLTGDKVAVLWAEDDFLDVLGMAAPGPVRTFGFSQEADCRIVGYRADGLSASVMRGELDGVKFECRLPALGRHQAANAAAAILAAHTAGVGVLEAAAGLEGATLPPMRMEVVEKGGVTFVLDNYNASPDSTIAAIKAVLEVPATGRRIAVLGEMRELGEFTESGHRMVGHALTSSPLDRILLTGGPTSFIAEEALKAGFPPDRLTLLDSLDFDAVRAFLALAEPGDVVLIKGSRSLGLEQALEEPAVS